MVFRFLISVSDQGLTVHRQGHKGDCPYCAILIEKPAMAQMPGWGTQP